MSLTEVLHDVKSTPFYNYMGLSQLTPGMETHANAIQTVLHQNFISSFGGKLQDIWLKMRLTLWQIFYLSFSLHI